MTRRKAILIALLLAGVFGLGWQFRAPPDRYNWPDGVTLDRAAWLGVTWSMDAHTDAEIDTLAAELTAYGIRWAFVYTSYLKPDNAFNPTYDHVRRFTERLHATAPDVVLLGWVGVPIQYTAADGSTIDNRLSDPATRALIANFAASVVRDMGFDGIHLNAEVIADGDPAYLQTVEAIRAALPPDATLSLALHALRMDRPVTLIPYPEIGFHMAPDYLREVAALADQVAIMAYDSGLFFPADYRRWVAYQTATAAETLAGMDVHLLIGLPASEEWTLSHNITTEYLANALYGLREGLLAGGNTVDGFAIYPYWEISAAEWALIDACPANR